MTGIRESLSLDRGADTIHTNIMRQLLRKRRHDSACGCTKHASSAEHIYSQVNVTMSALVEWRRHTANAQDVKRRHPTVICVLSAS